MKTSIWTWIAIVIVVLLAIILWFVTKNGSPAPLPEEVAEVFSGIEEDSDVDFSEPINAEFAWKYEATDGKMSGEIIDGHSISASGLTMSQQQAVEEAITGLGFTADVFNVSAGTIGSLTGYRRDDLAVLFQETVVGADSDSPSYALLIMAGYTSSQTSQSDEDLVAQAFMDKYNKTRDLVEVKIQEQVKSYASGSVRIGPGPDVDNTGWGGWLGVREDGQWNILWDGNGEIRCSDLAGYEFPPEITLAHQCN